MIMKTTEHNNRDLKLLSLLIERELDEEGSGAQIIRGSSFSLEPDPHRDDRFDYELRFELLKGVRATIADTWWSDAERRDEDICEQAKSIARSVEALWREREEVKSMLDRVTSQARREIAKARRRDIPYRLISATVSPIDAGNADFPDVEITLERLGASLIPETVTLLFSEFDDVGWAFADMLESQKTRRRRQVVLHASNADGEIDEVTLRFLQIQDCDIPSILSKLPNADGGFLPVDLPQVDGRARQVVLFWRDGVVHADLPLTDTTCWCKGDVSFKKVPNKFPAKPQGRLLSDFIEHEALPKDLRVISGHHWGDAAQVRVPVPTIRFNSMTGEAWAA